MRFFTRGEKNSLLFSLFSGNWLFFATRDLLRQALDELVVEVDAVVEVLDTDAFVSSVCAGVVDIEKYAGDAIGRDAADAEILAVSGAGVHHGNDGKTAIQLRAELFQLAHDLRIEWRARRSRRIAHHADADLIIGEDALQCALHIL